MGLSLGCFYVGTLVFTAEQIGCLFMDPECSNRPGAQFLGGICLVAPGLLAFAATVAALVYALKPIQKE
jgi:hypothetical protein